MQRVKKGLEHALGGEHQPEYGSHGCGSQNVGYEDNAFVDSGQLHLGVQNCGEQKAQGILDDEGNCKVYNRVFQAAPENLIFEHLGEIGHAHAFPQGIQAVPIQGGQLEGIENGVVNNDDQKNQGGQHPRQTADIGRGFLLLQFHVALTS